MNASAIIRGTVSNILGLNKDLKKERLKICRHCPLYLNKLGGICNPGLYINPTDLKISVEEKEGFIKGCGCILPNKASDPYSHCIINKW